MIRANNVGVDIKDEYLNSLAFWGMIYSMGKEEMARSLAYMMDFRNRLTQNNTPGIEYTDVFTAILFERLIEKYTDMFSGKVIELTFDGKKYIVISKGDWNIEKPLVGWMQQTEEKVQRWYMARTARSMTTSTAIWNTVSIITRMALCQRRT